MKVYKLTIVYNQETEEVEYLSEEIESGQEGVLENIGIVDMDEHFDEEDLDFISGCYIIGEA